MLLTRENLTADIFFMVDIKHSNAHDCPIVEAITPLFSSCQCSTITSKKESSWTTSCHRYQRVQYPRHRRKQWTHMANWYRYLRSPSRGIHRLTIYLVEAMNRLKASVGLLVSLSSEIAATQARFYSHLLTSPVAL
jgi:hypothetical protein